MNEHKHEWQIALNEVYCACQQTMTYADAERRINEYEVLKVEIERLRPEVRQFAWLMEQQLRKHDDKRGRRGWMDLEWTRLMERFEEEAEELLEGFDAGINKKDVAFEAADAANLAMMMADFCGGLAAIQGGDDESDGS